MNFRPEFWDFRSDFKVFKSADSRNSRGFQEFYVGFQMGFQGLQEF